jgi:hypothetical protein
MIKGLLLKKLSGKIGRSKFGGTRLGNAAQFVIDEDKRDEEGFGVQSNEFVEDMAYRRYCLRVISVCLLGELAVWLLVLLLPGVVLNLVIVLGLIFSKGGLLLLALPLGFGLYGTYASFRLWVPDLENQKPSDTGVMQSFQYQANSLKVWRIWTISSGVGAVNAILITIAYFYINDQWQQFFR